MNGTASHDIIEVLEKALGRSLDMDATRERLLVMWACCILDTEGMGPGFTYDRYLMGPYSEELADRLLERGRDVSVGIGEDAADRLSAIAGRGERYLEAYAVVLSIYDRSPGCRPAQVLERALDLKPDLGDEAMSALMAIIHDRNWRNGRGPSEGLDETILREAIASVEIEGMTLTESDR